MSQNIVPNVWCTRNAEEMGEFYRSVFRDTTSVVTARYPERRARLAERIRGAAAGR